MGIALVNQSISIEVNFDPGLSVGLTIFDDSGASPVQVGSIVPMLNVIDTLYRAKFTPAQAKSFIFRKAVYTDGTFTVLSDYSRSSEAVQVVDLPTLLSSGLTPVAAFIATISAVPAQLALMEEIESLEAIINEPPSVVAIMTE